MLAYYRYKVQKNMMTIDQVPEPYQSQLRAEMEPAPAPEPIEEEAV